MNVLLKFLGAAGTVTGSKYLLSLNGRKILIDCGLFQGLKELRLRNWDSIPQNVSEIDLVIITHAHIDHTGYLPRLVREGFKGKILCTHATQDLMHIMLKDAARLQEEEAAFAFKRGYSRHSKPEPLFTLEDAEKVFPLIQSHPMNKSIDADPQFSIRFINSGHILGASCVEMTIHGKNGNKIIVFSGDIGRYNDPIMHAPDPVKHADILVMESTYGDKTNPDTAVEDGLEKIINDSRKLGGPVIIPAFAVGRTQTLIYYIQKLIDQKRIPPLSVYIDSPMAISVTGLYENHPGSHKIEVVHDQGENISLFDASNIHYCNTPESSKALNDLRRPCIIISASGMATGGRILHHMFHRLPDPSTTFLFVGYQAAGTRGRDLVEGKESIKMFGEYVSVRARIRVVNGLSAHADQPELMRWLGKIENKPKMVFVTHGEPTVSKAFAEKIEETFGWQVFVPEYLESFVLFDGI
ncbi:MAG: MBL fold metallo-hydrolase RNA specificity domain-containing protein [Cyclobacteriaceae bacterium]